MFDRANVKHFKTDDCALTQLKAGESILLSGELIVMRDAAHKRLAQNGFNDIKLKDKIVYYMGPSPAKSTQVSGSAGPTTSARMDVYTPAVYGKGCIATIGKGNRSKEVIDSIIKHHVVYLTAIGGAGALYGQCVKKQSVLLFPDLDAEAVRVIEVENFPAVVAIDAQGNSIYQ